MTENKPKSEEIKESQNWQKVDLKPDTPEYDEWLKEIIAKANAPKRKK